MIDDALAFTALHCPRKKLAVVVLDLDTYSLSLTHSAWAVSIALVFTATTTSSSRSSSLSNYHLLALKRFSAPTSPVGCCHVSFLRQSGWHVSGCRRRHNRMSTSLSHTSRAKLSQKLFLDEARLDWHPKWGGKRREKWAFETKSATWWIQTLWDQSPWLANRFCLFHPGLMMKLV